MEVRFYCDEHVDLAISNALQKRGVDVLTAQDADMLGATDEDHLQLAVSQNRVIFTQDTDFLRLHKSGINHYGIAYAKQGTPISKIIQGLLLIYQVLSEDEIKGKVEYL